MAVSKVTQKICEDARDLVEAGVPPDKAASVLGISRSTLYKIRSKGYDLKEYSKYQRAVARKYYRGRVGEAEDAGEDDGVTPTSALELIESASRCLTLAEVALRGQCEPEEEKEDGGRKELTPWKAFVKKHMEEGDMTLREIAKLWKKEKRKNG